jgi:Uma2 family endonuclease
MIPKEYLPRYTFEDYKNWQGNWELIEGHPFALEPLQYDRHRNTIVSIMLTLKDALSDCPNDVYAYLRLPWIISLENIVKPDISILCKPTSEYIKTTPKIIFEVVASSEATKDEKIKFDIYKKEEVEFYILVYPFIEKVKAFKLDGKDYTKIFDDSEGTLELKICNCPTNLNIRSFFE